MSHDFRGSLNALHGVRRWVEAVVSSVMDGRHVLILTGGYVEAASLWELVRDACLERNLDPVRIEPALAQGTSPEQALAAACGVEDPGPFRPASTVEDDWSSLRQVCSLHGIGDQPEATANTWYTYLRRVARHGWSSRRSMLLVEDRVPEELLKDLSGTAVAVHVFSELPSVLETRLLCRTVLDGAPLTAEQRWREAVLPSFTAPDMALLEALWDPILGPWRGIVETVRGVARERGLTPPRVAELSISGAPARNSEQARRLWDLGLLQRTPENGDELSVLVLAAQEAEKELRHRAWRGQAALLLPLLDDLRMHGCRILTDRHGRDWPLEYPYLREDERERAMADPLATDYPALVWVFKRRQRPGGFKPSKDSLLVDALIFGRQLRNDLAHYSAVEYSQYRRLLVHREAIQ